MANLPIQASSELDQIFGGSDDEDDSMLFPMTRTATASDLLDDGFGTRAEDKEDSLLMDVLVQRPRQPDQSDEQSQEEADKMEKERNLLLSLKEDAESSEREEEESTKQNKEKDTLKYGLRDRNLIRKRPPQDAAYYGEESYHQNKPKKKDPEPDSAGDSPSQEEGEGDDEDDDSEDDTLYCTCKQPHGGRFMICCDKCEEWYHGSCVGVSVAMGKRMEKAGIDYVCPPCKDKERKDKSELNKELKEKRLQSRGKLKQEVPIAESESTPNVPKPAAGKSEEKRRLSSVEGEKKSPTKKVKDLNGDRKTKLDKLVEDRRRFLLGDAVPDESAMKKCIVSTCTHKVLPPTLFCSDGCVERYAAEALNTLLEYGMSTQGGINVIDTATGKVIMYATSRTNLVPFLKQHRSYMVHLPSGPNPMKKKKQQKQTTPGGEKKEEKKVESPVKKKREEVVEKDSVELKGSKGQKNPEDLRHQAKKALYLILLKRVQETDDLKDTDKAELEAIAGDIEDNLFTIHKDVNHKYKARYRSLLFNLKDEKNKALFRRVVSKTISSDQLVVMSHDQLASDELSKWREEELKKNIDAIKEREKELNKKEGTVRKITKKGEEEIEREYEAPSTDVEPTKPLPVIDPRSTHNTTAEHHKHLFDADCDICQGKVVRGIESQEPLVEGGGGEGGGGVHNRIEEDGDGGSNSGSKDQLDEEEGTRSDTALSPPGDQQSPDVLMTPSEEPEKNEQSSWQSAPPPPHGSSSKEDFRSLVKKSLYKLLHSRVKDISEVRSVGRAKLEQVALSIENGLFSKHPSMDAQYKRQYRKVVAGLKDKGNGILISKVVKGELEPSQLTHLSSEELSHPVWKGHVYQQGLAKFVATASQVAGIHDHLLQMFPDVLNIVGRISFRDVWAYLDKIKQIPTKSISVVRFDWLDEGRSAYMSLLDYLVGRQRIGVVDVKKTMIKDFYMVPLLSGEDIPKVLRDIPDSIGLTTRHSDDLLLGVIVRTGNRGNIQAPPPMPVPRHSRVSSTHREEAGFSTVELKSTMPLVLEVGLGDKTPPLPGESPLLLPTASHTQHAGSEKPGYQLTHPPITVYGTVEGLESKHSAGGSTVGVSSMREDHKDTGFEEETTISESSLSPLSDLCDEENMDSINAGNESAYSPSAPIEAGEEYDEPYSPSNQTPLEEKMDTDTTAVTQEKPGPPQTETLPSTSLSNEQSIPLVSEVNVPQVSQPSVSTATDPSPQPTEPAQLSSAVSNVQLQNLLAKLPILAKSILGKSSSESPAQVETSGGTTVSQPVAPPTTAHFLGGSSHSNTVPGVNPSSQDRNLPGLNNQQAVFQRYDPRKRAWQQ